jgi:hypothetical protein
MQKVIFQIGKFGLNFACEVFSRSQVHFLSISAHYNPIYMKLTLNFNKFLRMAQHAMKWVHNIK